jgi:magnesium transporter
MSVLEEPKEERNHGVATLSKPHSSGDFLSAENLNLAPRTLEPEFLPGNFSETAAPLCRASHLHSIWKDLTEEERLSAFRALDFADAQELFLDLSSEDQATIVLSADLAERRLWLRLLAPDDAADVIQQAVDAERKDLLDLLDHANHNVVSALLAYKDDVAGGLMNPRYVRARAEMSVAEAISYVRQQALDHVETIYYIYVLGCEQELLGVISLRELFISPPDQLISTIMHTDLIVAQENTDQEELGHLFARHNLIAIPVVDDGNCMKGIVTIDDIVDVVEEEATEDIQKIGGVQAFQSPYLRISILEMIKKRAGWLTILFIGELLTANAMGHFQDQISKAVVLALFIPLIISSGGNAGSQASTLVIRAMALGELHLRDWWKVMRREVIGGLALGAILAILGLARVVIWQHCFHCFGSQYLLIGLTVAVSLIGVVVWGCITGSLLPLVLRRAGFDPASASTPFVATLVDVTGLVIYFSVANLLLKGTLL